MIISGNLHQQKADGVVWSETQAGISNGHLEENDGGGLIDHGDITHIMEVI